MANFHRWYNKDEKDMSPAEKAFFKGRSCWTATPCLGSF